MGIWFVQPKKYKCSNCGSLNCVPYADPPKSIYAGHNEGVLCQNCGHKGKIHYVKSVYEQEMGSGHSGWSDTDTDKPEEF